MTADWDKIKAEYIAGGTSYSKLAKKHEVSVDCIKKRATKEKWSEQRHQVSTKSALKIQEKVVQQKTKAAVDQLDVARYTTLLWQDTLRDIATLISENKETYAADLQGINYMSSAIKSNIDNLYRVTRMLTASEERKLQLEERRLELEEKKFEAEQKAANDLKDGGIVVTMQLPEGVDFG